MFLYTMLLFVLVRFVIAMTGHVQWRNFRLNISGRKVRFNNNLFGNNYIDSKVLFAARFNALPNISLINYIDSSKAYALIMENFGNEVTAVYQYNTFDYNESKTLFNRTIFVLRNKRIIELGYDYAEILYTGRDYAWANILLSDLANFRVNIKTKVIGFAHSGVMN